jgi:hypothetical protein
VRFVFLLAFALALLVVPAFAEDNCTNSTLNCTEACESCNCTSNITSQSCNYTYPWQNVSFNFVISPGETIADSVEYSEDNVTLNYEVQCIACSQDIDDRCSIDKTIDPGDDYSRHTEYCDVDIECESCDDEDQICADVCSGNRTIGVPLIMQTRNNDKELVIHVGDSEVVHSIGKGMDYSSEIEFQCPSCSDENYEDTNWSFQKCKAYADNLCINQDSANIMVKYLSGAVTTMANSSNECGGQLVACRDERDKYKNDKDECENSLNLKDVELQGLSDDLSGRDSRINNITRSLKACEEQNEEKENRAAFFILLICFLGSLGVNGFLIFNYIRIKTDGGVEN